MNVDLSPVVIASVISDVPGFVPAVMPFEEMTILPSVSTNWSSSLSASSKDSV